MTTAVPGNAVAIRNLAMGANYVMSHILHFYHLVALDYVDVNGTGLIPKGFFCPNYDNNYYARGIDPVLQTGGLPNLGINAPAYTINNAPVANPGIPAGALGDLTPYLAGQYVRALKFRRMAQQLGAIFTGKMPHASMYTPGCVTTKAYNPNPAGPDVAVVEKFHELMYGGPGMLAGNISNYLTGSTNRTHPLNGGLVTMANPHPESIMGFIGKPIDFWAWAADQTGPTTGGGGVLGTNIGFDPGFLPHWAQLGVPAATPGHSENAQWKYGGTYLFDVVAAAHCIPEYFWFGQGYGRYLAWGIFEGADIMGFGDTRLITRGRTHVPYCANSSGAAYGLYSHPAQHFNSTAAGTTADPKEIVQEYTPNSWYDDTTLNTGRHPWKGKTKANPDKSAYTFAKAPRYFNTQADVHALSDPQPTDDWIPYEVGPLARGMANARGLTGGTPSARRASVGEVIAVNNGAAYAYYPGILADVDAVIAANAGALGLGGGLGASAIGVFPQYGANLTGTLQFLGVNSNGAFPFGAPGNPTNQPVFYLPPNAVNATAVLTNAFHCDHMGGATADRIAARCLETYFVAAQMLTWFNSITPGGTVCKTKTWSYKKKTTKKRRTFCAPKKGKGCGLTEAPRGALGHWIKVGKKNNDTDASWKGKVHKYQIITPTAWNISPKDHRAPGAGIGDVNNNEGPIEQSIIGTPLVSDSEPLEILRVIHSFDPCCACTVHVSNVKKEKVFEATLDPLM